MDPLSAKLRIKSSEKWIKKSKLLRELKDNSNYKKTDFQLYLLFLHPMQKKDKPNTNLKDLCQQDSFSNYAPVVLTL